MTKCMSEWSTRTVAIKKRSQKVSKNLVNTKVFMSLPRPSIETLKAKVTLRKLEDKWEERNENR